MDNNKTLYLYTDGACRMKYNVGAWAYILRWGEKTLEYCQATRNTTNNEMELMAVYEGLFKIKDREIQLMVSSDSKYVVDGLNDWIWKWETNNWKNSSENDIKNLNLFRKLHFLRKKFNKITILWVRRNSNEYNKKCDFLCNLAMDEMLKGKN